MASEKTGRIVWHDLFTDNAGASKSFYEQIAGWNYVVERATDFAWGGGERDFILALSDDEAGAGFVELDDQPFLGWVPYVEVADVDFCANKAVELFGSIAKPPFDVPGVGRNCLVRDPNGALLGICLSRHNFPIPTVQFGPEIYGAPASGFPVDFYRGLFDWKISTSNQSTSVTHRITGTTGQVAFSTSSGIENPSWIPSVRVAQFSKTLQQLEDINGSIVHRIKGLPNDTPIALIRDSNGILCSIVSK